MQEEIKKKLKKGPEQQLVVGPLVERLVSYGWSLGQIVFGKNEWKVPKTPSEASKRENRYREIEVPIPESEAWAKKVSKPFREYFTGIADAKSNFVKSTSKDEFDYIASVSAFDK